LADTQQTVYPVFTRQPQIGLRPGTVSQPKPDVMTTEPRCQSNKGIQWQKKTTYMSAVVIMITINLFI